MEGKCGMKTRRIVTIVFAASLFLACGDDPFNPGQNDDSRFYPLAVGNTWNYTRFGTYNIDSLSYTIVGSSTVNITGTAQHSGGFQVFVEETMISDTIQGLMVVETADTSYIRVTSAGFFGYPGISSTDSSWTVPFPLITGMVWAFQTEPAVTGEILSLTADVSVPAGNFQDCLEMRTTWIEGGNVVNTADFAPNVGMVRNIYSQGAGQFTTEVTSRLSSFDLAE
jgi:hypothetical protein